MPSEQDRALEEARRAARAWIEGYGIRTEPYTRSGGDHPMMDTLPDAFLAFATALRRAPDASAVAMRERCAKVVLRSCYGPPSGWPGKFPRGWKPPMSWDVGCAPTPAEASMHDNGCMDAYIAIRALDTAPPTAEGGRDA